MAAGLGGLPPARLAWAILTFFVRRIFWLQLATAPAQVHAPCDVCCASRPANFGPA
jgi:hypothetical protein